MKTMSTREAKNGFGLMIDTARATSALIEKHGRGVVIVMSVGAYERLSLLAEGAANAKEKVVGCQKVPREPLAHINVDRAAKKARGMRYVTVTDRHQLLALMAGRHS